MAIKMKNISKTSNGKLTVVLFGIFFFAVLLMGSCKKDPKEDPETEAGDIYVAGTEFNGTNYVAKVWHNGIVTNLTDGTNRATANNIVISDTNVYVKGIETIGTIDIGRIWKNGKLIFSTDSRFTNNLKSFFVVGNDVYAVGDEYDPSSAVSQKVWKNGILSSMKLNTDTARNYSVDDIFVQSGNIYIAGTIQYRDALNNTISYACYWKNGVLNKMPMIGDRDLNWGMNIFVEGSDVYLLGRGQEKVAKQTAILWKNGSLVFKDTLYNSYPANLFVSKGTPYFVGSQLPLGSNIMVDKTWYAFQWNNKFTSLGTTGSSAYDIKVFGSDVYVSGYYSNGSKSVATVWKNGIAQNISDGKNDAAAYAVFVK